jgi:uncharacterized protein (TIGR02301 family)
MKSVILRPFAGLCAAALLFGVSIGPALAVASKSSHAEASRKAEKSPEKSKTPDKTPPADAPPAESAPPYEPQLLRLAELLGALTYLQDLCGHHDGDVWRAKMAALLEAEAKTPLRKERLAGAFNRGYQGYALTYRLCTVNAQAIIARFLTESAKIAHDVVHRYGPS